MGKAPREVWSKLASGESQELIVELDGTEIQTQAARLNRKRGLAFDDSTTIRFRTDQYSTLKAAVILTLPPGEFEILKNYDALPLMFIRFGSVQALNVLLAHRSVLRVHKDNKEDLLRPGAYNHE